MSTVESLYRFGGTRAKTDCEYSSANYPPYRVWEVKANVKVVAEITVRIANGCGLVDRMSWNNLNVSTTLMKMIENYLCGV
ncbi:hypothetical protein GCM10020370_16910 [Paenibacillus hodogayensis]